MERQQHALGIHSMLPTGGMEQNVPLPAVLLVPSFAGDTNTHLVRQYLQAPPTETVHESLYVTTWQCGISATQRSSTPTVRLVRPLPPSLGG